MAMMQYFQAFGAEADRLRNECGMPTAIAGIFKAPLDILADKLRGYIGLANDLEERPDKVLAACQALMPHLLHMALAGADPQKLLPIGFWMHRGCVPFISPEQFRNIYWPTLKPIIENIWAAGHQTLFYAEGEWDHHLEAFAELPDAASSTTWIGTTSSKYTEYLGHKFCICGGVAQHVVGLRIARRSSRPVPQDHRRRGWRRRLHHGRQRHRPERRPGGKRAGDDRIYPRVWQLWQRSSGRTAGRPIRVVLHRGNNAVGTRVPPARAFRGEKLAEITRIQRHQEMVERVWTDVDGLGNMFIWQLLVSF